MSEKDFGLLLAKDAKDDDPAYQDYQRMIKYKIRERRVVNVIHGHGGVGKTHQLFKEWEGRTELKKMYMSHSHDFLDEQASRVAGSRHIFGLRWMCPCLDEESETFNPVIKRLAAFGIANRYICGTCEKMGAFSAKNCPYHLQFKDLPNTVMLPVEYAYTKHLENYKPDIIAVDDCILRKEDHPSRVVLEKLLDRLQFVQGIEEEDRYNLSTLVNADDEEQLKVWMRELTSSNRRWIKAEIEEVIERPQTEWILYLGVAKDPQVFLKYRELVQIHGFRKQFATPALFHLFDYICEYPKSKLIIIEALPNERFLLDMAERYFKETNNLIEYNPREIRLNRPSADSKIFRCRGTRSDAWYPTTTSIVESELTRQAIKHRIKAILDTYPNRGFDLDIGLIIPKRCRPSQFFDPVHDITTLTWGNLRGKNKLEHCNPLFVIGTYIINKEDMVKEHGLWYAHDPDTDRFAEEDEAGNLKRHGGYYHYLDEKMECLRYMKENYEQYQGVFRARPLNNPKHIYCFGLIPEEIPNFITRKDLQFERKGGGLMVESRREFLENLVEKHGEECPERLARETLRIRFKIGDERSRQEIRRIVKESPMLKLEWLDKEGEKMWLTKSRK